MEQNIPLLPGLDITERQLATEGLEMACGSQFSWVTARVVRGHGVASGPAGTIVRQLPHFLRLGLDLRDCWPGTINLSIAPRSFSLANPNRTFELVRWDDRLPPETFSFSRCCLRTGAAESDAWIYYPHPETKPEHFQPPGVLEVMAPLIEGLGYGDTVELGIDPTEVELIEA